ncbi:hypothetical protein PMI29_01957 [Pseudomonas sp. GM49]|uniref:hypothetical protein n=1 Tax=Pseudomonas sp. GM49 TaxID=1144331 RepID=UPI00027079E1|nr:hypothetical protein [Pseudomonas sp. GM49]EJM69334.1 hypothetical protein PMI29_01957 [Pseudomonas sp. GM49]
MEVLRALAALWVVLGIVGFWIYKSRYMLALTPFFAPLIVCVLHLYCAYWIYFKSTSFGEPFLALALAQFASRPAHSVLNRIDLAAVQIHRDMVAHKIFDSGLTAPFALYLRPFSTTDRFSFYGLSTKWGGVDLESLIAYACKPWGLLLGLGREGDAVGAGKLYSSDEEWEKKFAQLSDKASAIVVVPGVGRGSLFEIEWIIQHGLLDKTTFLMPPSTLLRMPGRSRWASSSNQELLEQNDALNWVNVSVHLKPLGILLPPYDPEGAVIQFYGSKGHFSQQTLGRDVPSIKQVLRDRVSQPDGRQRHA